MDRASAEALGWQWLDDRDATTVIEGGRSRYVEGHHVAEKRFPWGVSREMRSTADDLLAAIEGREELARTRPSQR